MRSESVWIKPTRVCRSCSAVLGPAILDFSDVPVAGIYLRSNELDLSPHANLSLHCCTSCSLAQLGQTISDAYYRQYHFSGSHVSGYIAHMEQTLETLNLVNISPGALVVEAGSNDGTMLMSLSKKGFKAVGFEPSQTIPHKDLAGLATLIPDFFSIESAEKVGLKNVDVFLARHVLEHVDNLSHFISSISQVLRTGGLAVLEVPDAKALVAQRMFSNLFHEHLCYFTDASLENLMTMHGFAKVLTRQVPAHGGSLICVFEKTENTSPVLGRLLLAGDEEHLWDEMAGEAKSFLKHFRDDLVSLKAQGGLAGYGASQRTVSLTGLAGIGPGVIDFFVDANPNYHGYYLPGTEAPIFPPSALLDKRPRNVIVFARSFEDDIFRGNSEYRRQGGTFYHVRGDRLQPMLDDSRAG